MAANPVAAAARLALLVCLLLSSLVAPAAPSRANAAESAVQTAYLPLVLRQSPTVNPAGQFLAVNGGPIDGLDGALPFPGNLAHDPALRAKSLFWMQQAGIHWFRNYSSDGIVYSWRFTQPAEGVFDWTVWDILVKEAQKKDVALLASIGNSAPEWANGSKSWRDKPLDLYAEPMQNTAWYKFVRAFVERYDGDGVDDMPGLTRPIKYWEFWNEPDLRFPGKPPHQFNGTVQDYVRLSQVGYAAVKAADPTATVVGPSTAQWAGNTTYLCVGAAVAAEGPDYPIPPYVEPEAASNDPGSDDYPYCWFIWTWQEWMNAGGLQYVDIVSFVRYMTDSDGWDSGGYVETILNLADANRGGKPVWLVETGWIGSPTNANGLHKARNFVRVAVIFWHRPFMERLTWYDLQESQSYNGSSHRALFQTLSGDSSLGKEPDPYFHPVHRSAEVMSRVLRGFTTSQRPALITMTPTVRVYKFTGNGRQVWVFWSRDSSEPTIYIDTGGLTTRRIGLFGEDLGLFAGGAIAAGPRPNYLTTDLTWSQAVFRITGRVSDGARPTAPDNGVANALVALSGPVNASAMTDGDGNYIFEALPEGTYTVSLPGLNTTPASQIVVLTDRKDPWGRTSFAVN